MVATLQKQSQTFIETQYFKFVYIGGNVLQIYCKVTSQKGKYNRIFQYIEMKKIR